MIIRIKDAIKLIGVFIIMCCVSLVCTMFLNFYFDIILIKNKITSESAMYLYNAQISTAKVVVLITGGCLLLTSIIMLVFYLKNYIDQHSKELGILKALGYSNMKIAKNFWIFGFNVFLGTVIGFIGAFLLMPSFYALQNEDYLLPKITINFHPSILIYFIIIPTLFFSIFSIIYGYFKLKNSVLSLLHDTYQTKYKSYKKMKQNNKNSLFLHDLRINILKSKKILIFFVIFASFCFSAMTQMAFSMKDLSSEMMGVMILIIGLILSFVILYLAISTLIKENLKTISIMRIFGYSHQECCNAILNGYRPLAYFGFVLGTIYQYLLLRIMVDIVFKNIENVPKYKFDFPIMFISLFIFIVSYELLMFTYYKKVKNSSIKEIMSK